MKLQPSNPSRRDFLRNAAGTGAALLLTPAFLRPAEPDPRVAQIVAKTIVVDMHNHIQIHFAKTPADARPDPTVDLADEMKKAGFTTVCQTFNVDTLPNIEPGDYYKYFLQALAYEDRLLKQNNMKRALTLKDLEAAHAAKQPTIIQSVEGAEFMDGRLDRVEESYHRGLRHLQPLHEKDDMVKPIGDVITAPAHLGGFTQAGADAVKECNRLGILVDMAHGTTETVMGALKVATQPLIMSHTSMARDTDDADTKRRSVSKDTARAVAEAGGLIGLWRSRWTSLVEYVNSVKAMTDLIGIDHVAIGTDTDLTASYMLPYTNRIWTDQNEGFFYAVAAEMLKQGFAPEEIGKFGGGNFCRVFGKVTAGRA
jgi:membrane dipeptidase